MLRGEGRTISVGCAGAAHALSSVISYARTHPIRTPDELELAIARAVPGSAPSSSPNRDAPPPDDDPDASRVVALVELARGGDSEAFGQLYDHYADVVFRYVYYRVADRGLAEDLTGDVFVRALRALPRFTWQGRDFGAWLTTIARNLISDHYKSSRAKREVVADDLPDADDQRAGPEQEAVANDKHNALMTAIRDLPADQQECVISRFMLERSIAETAQSMGRTAGAIKQLQLRAIRTLSRSMPEELR